MKVDIWDKRHTYFSLSQRKNKGVKIILNSFLSYPRVQYFGPWDNIRPIIDWTLLIGYLTKIDAVNCIRLEIYGTNRLHNVKQSDRRINESKITLKILIDFMGTVFWSMGHFMLHEYFGHYTLAI